MSRISIQDDSGDKKYFTLVPNYILNHSSAIDQSLYLQMKRYAGENGACTASEKTLMAKMKIGRSNFRKSINYLLEHKWVEFLGERIVDTPGGPQKVKTYKINDIWKMNTEHYQGVSETAPLPQRGVQNDIKGVSETAPNKNIHNKELNNNAQPQESPDGDIVDNLLKEIEKDGIKHEFQYLALDMLEKLNVPDNKKGECFRIAKNYPRGHVMSSLGFAMDYPRRELKWKMFLWKLNSLRKESRAKTG